MCDSSHVHSSHIHFIHSLRISILFLAHIIQGSLCVFIHALRTKLLRESTFHQLMILLSISDMLGSMAYAFTTLPIPSEYYFEGAHGNEATCIAQGFFIQLGTMSAYTNCSLAAYYYLVIKQGASENALRKHRPWLFTCPIAVGLAFAFAGKYRQHLLVLLQNISFVS